MITLFIFYAHTIAAAVLFTRRWQEANWKEGVMAVVFLALLFSVGWSIATFLLKLVMEEKGFGRWLDRDTLSLLLLTVMESIFYHYQFKREHRRMPVPPRVPEPG